MEYQDTYVLETPEGLGLTLQLAGVGSRFTAGMIDGAIQLCLLVAVAVLASAIDTGTAAAFALIGIFLVLFGYDVAFETLASGRTPGKRLTGLRTMLATGAPITFVPSAVRNLLRLVDFLPFAYLVGMTAVVVSPRNQRLGDMAAGTIVVRERSGGRKAAAVDAALPALEDEAATWDVSAVTVDDLTLVRQFLARRATFAPEARQRLAAGLDQRLRPRVVGPTDEVDAERFLEQLAAAKAARG